MEDELNGGTSFPTCLNWAYEWLESHDEVNQPIAVLAGLQPTDTEEIKESIMQIIRREITPAEKQEFIGQKIRDLGKSSLDRWTVVDELVKMKDFLEDSSWIDWILKNADTLDAQERELFKPGIEAEFNYILDLWVQYPTYSEFKSHFDPWTFRKEQKSTILYRNCCQFSYTPYKWQSKYDHSLDVFKVGMKREYHFVTVSVEITEPRSIHIIAKNSLNRLKKEKADFRLIDQGMTKVSGVDAKWFTISYSWNNVEAKTTMYFVANSLYSFTIIFDADVETYASNQTDFDDFLTSFKLL